MKLLDGRVGRLLADPKRWVRGNFAHDERGRPVDPRSSDACKFCLLGAVEHEYRQEALTEAFDALSGKLGDRVAVSDFNDSSTTTHQDILDLLEQTGV